jgi:hypothetical protein
MSSLAADDRTDSGVMAQSLGVVDILYPAAAEHRLPQLPTRACRPFLPVRASASLSPAVSERPRAFVKLAIGKQPSIGGDDQTAKLEHQPAVEIEPECPRWSIHPPGSP